MEPEPEWNKFTQKARNAVEAAIQEAARHHMPLVSDVHLLFGILVDPDNVACRIMARAGVSIETLRHAVVALTTGEPAPEADPDTSVLVTRQETEMTRRICVSAGAEAAEMDNNYIGTEHIVLGILRHPEALSARLLGEAGVGSHVFRAEILKLQEFGTVSNDPIKDNLADILLALRHQQEAVREQAVQRLQLYASSTGTNAEKDAHTAAEALEAWGNARRQTLQQRPVVEALLIAIEDSSARVRAHSALMLGHGSLPEAQDALLRHLRNDPSRQVRMMCVTGLGWSPDSVQKVEGFIAALQDPHDQVVFPACKALGKLGDKQAVQPLRSVLDHPSWQVRFDACEALVRLDAVDSRVMATLEGLARQPEAAEHDQSVFSANEMVAQFEPGADKAHTVHEVLDQARRAFQCGE